MNWLERARREIPKSARDSTAITAERALTAATAVPTPDLCEKFEKSNGSNAVPHHRAFQNLTPLGNPAIVGMASLDPQATRQMLMKNALPTSNSMLACHSDVRPGRTESFLKL
jgi:hypothetical protein